MLQILNLFVEGQRLSNAVCSERTDWLQYNDREKRLVQNTVMLVGLLYKMCKLQLEALAVPLRYHNVPLKPAKTARVTENRVCLRISRFFQNRGSWHFLTNSPLWKSVHSASRRSRRI